MTTHKVCTLCLVRKQISEFSLVRRGQIARRYRCKPCEAILQKEAFQRNPEENRKNNTEAKRQWRAKDIEGVRARARAHYHEVMKDPAEREKVKARGRTPEHKARTKAFREANPELCKLYARRFRCRNHGITLEQYEALALAQEGRCAICQEKPEGCKGKTLCVDHDHRCCPGTRSCGKCIRGLLCVPCNRAIGGFRDNLSILRSAVAYMEKA